MTAPPEPYEDMSDWGDATHLIREWVNGGGVNSQRLARELRYWAWWAENSFGVHSFPERP